MKKILSIITIALLGVFVIFSACRNDASSTQETETTEEAAPATEESTQEMDSETQEAANEGAEADTTQAQ